MFNIFKKKSIQSEILSDIKSAKKSIKVAVSWLTDKTLIDALLKKRKEGVSVEVLLSADSYNIVNFELFKELQSIGGKVQKWGHSNSMDGSFMHMKTYIIDDSIAKSGSYNWSVNAQTNAETLDKVDLETKRQEIAHYYSNSQNFFEGITNPENMKNEIIRELNNMKRENNIMEPHPEKFQEYRSTQEAKKEVKREYEEKQRIIDQQNAIKEKEWKEREAKLKQQQIVKERELKEREATLKQQQMAAANMQNSTNTPKINSSQYLPKPASESTTLPPTDYANN